MKKETPVPPQIGKYSFSKQPPLGQGATGTVYHAKDNSNQQPVAIKHIDMATIRDDATRSLLQNQIKALKLLSHPNILKLQDLVQTPEHLYLVTQLLEGGTLKDFLAKRGPLDESEAMTIFKTLVAGCSAIIDGGVIHRDLKPGNIMLHKNQPKIIDFGFCEVILGGGVVRAFNVGSPAYMAPEALLRTLYSEKSDSWSLGVILYEMLHGETPDRGMQIKDFLQKVRVNPNFIKESIKAGLNSNVRQILEKSLLFKTEDRVSISNMKYLADVFMINQKKKSTTAGSQIRNSLTSSTPTSAGSLSPSPLFLNNIQTEPTKRDSAVKSKIASTIMYTQLPGKRMKQNVDKVQPNSTQYFSVSGNPNIRTQPYSFTKTTQPQGYISYTDFMRPSQTPKDQNRRSQIGVSCSSIKTGATTQESKVSEVTSLRDLMKEQVQRQNGSGKQIMERPPGQPLYRQVTVRYL